MDAQSRKSPKNGEAELWNAIAAFEKILEAMPNDRVSLETLAGAYEQIGDHARAREYFIKLANVLIDESDEDAANEMLKKLASAAPDDPQVKELSTRLKTHTPDKIMADILEDEAADTTTPPSPGIAAEMTLAWNLLQAKKLTQENYSKVVQDLSEISTQSSGTPVSALHVLRGMNFPNMNSVLEFVSSSCKTPFISLAAFDIQESAALLLPLPFSIERGALLFELMGNDAMVAVLNPYDDQLPMDIETITGKTSHFFLVAPDDFDKALSKVAEMHSEHEQTSG